MSQITITLNGPGRNSALWMYEINTPNHYFTFGSEDADYYVDIIQALLDEISPHIGEALTFSLNEVTGASDDFSAPNWLLDIPFTLTGLEQTTVGGQVALDFSIAESDDPLHFLVWDGMVDATFLNGAVATESFRTATIRVTIGEDEDPSGKLVTLQDLKIAYDGANNYTDYYTNDAIRGALTNVADEHSRFSTYAVGDYVIYSGTLYKCITAVSTAGPFDITQWEVVNVMDEMPEAGVEITGTLAAGATTLTLSNSAITTSSMVEIYTTEYGIAPTTVTTATGSITMTFDALDHPIDVKVVLK